MAENSTHISPPAPLPSSAPGGCLGPAPQTLWGQGSQTPPPQAEGSFPLFLCAGEEWELPESPVNPFSWRRAEAREEARSQSSLAGLEFIKLSLLREPTPAPASLWQPHDGRRTKDHCTASKNLCCEQGRPQAAASGCAASSTGRAHREFSPAKAQLRGLFLPAPLWLLHREVTASSLRAGDAPTSHSPKGTRDPCDLHTAQGPPGPEERVPAFQNVRQL